MKQLPEYCFKEESEQAESIIQKIFNRMIEREIYKKSVCSECGKIDSYHQMCFNKEWFPYRIEYI
jgi:hypothetical protein